MPHHHSSKKSAAQQTQQGSPARGSFQSLRDLRTSAEESVQNARKVSSGQHAGRDSPREVAKGVFSAYDPRKGGHTRGVTLVAKHKKHRLRVQRGSCRTASPRSFESSEENVKMVHNNTPEDFAERMVSAYDPRRGEHTRRAELILTQISVYVRPRYCGEAAGFGNRARGYNG